MNTVEAASPKSDAERTHEQITQARELNRQWMIDYQKEMDRMMAATISPWLAVIIGCIVGAGAFAAGAITAKLFWL